MSPPPIRTRAEQQARLLEAALVRLHEHGPEALRARDLTAQVGASTQALYTLFGGMPGLIEALAGEGFTRLADHIRAVPESDDPVADHLSHGWAYVDWALKHPHLYRLMFGLTGSALSQHPGLDTTLQGAQFVLPEGQAAVTILVASVERMGRAGRIDCGDPQDVARQFLAVTHGYVLLEMAGAIGSPEDSQRTAASLALTLLLGLGDTREAAERSLGAVLATRT